MDILQTASCEYQLERIPASSKGSLRTWDAADELLLNEVFSQHLLQTQQQPILIINDAFGALAISLHEHQVHCWSDSYISHLATQQNSNRNKLETNYKLIGSSEELTHHYRLVLIKIPKTLSLLEDQLYRLKNYINNDTAIIAAGMSKHIHRSTLKQFETILGTTSTSRAVKKARLIFTKHDRAGVGGSPYPKTIFNDEFKLTLINHANVFANDKLDQGTRFFLNHLDQCPQANNIIDLGCGNGALGILAKQAQPHVRIHFIDESYAAIASAKASYSLAHPTQLNNAQFSVSNSLDQYHGDKAELILCNPPFHQLHSTGDAIAWKMFKDSRQVLNKAGELWIIGNRHLGYHTKLKKLFGNCKTIAANKKFVLLSASRH